MKRFFLILGFILMLLVGCTKTIDTVTINTDINSYTPAMSSVQGITMTPNFKSEKSFSKLIYHWTTTEGEFIGAGNEVNNQGEAVIWSAIENDKVTEIKIPFDIRLEVIDSESQKILANTKLTIIPNNGFYEIKK